MFLVAFTLTGKLHDKRAAIKWAHALSPQPQLVGYHSPNEYYDTFLHWINQQADDNDKMLLAFSKHFQSIDRSSESKDSIDDFGAWR
uniref:Uncharacterized protein n=1 Tax=Romanomermis culicivorax TaxID=13658 RepID=A0A915I2F9_ROMCU